MNKRTEVPPLSLYEQDETAWLEQTAELVAQRRFGEIDPQHLSEYLADMARRDKREVLSRLTILLAHLLKWDYQVAQRSNSWQATILSQRQELRDLFESGTLLNYALTIRDKAYERAVKQAGVESGSDDGVFPATCPWSFAEIVPEE
jgi:hypothetical protein